MSTGVSHFKPRAGSHWGHRSLWFEMTDMYQCVQCVANHGPRGPRAIWEENTSSFQLPVSSVHPCTLCPMTSCYNISAVDSFFKKLLILYWGIMTNLDSILKSRDITLPTKVRLVKAMVFQLSCMDVRVGLWRKLSAKELMLLNCGVGEDSWESLGLQGDPTSAFWRRSALGFLWKEWC